MLARKWMVATLITALSLAGSGPSSAGSNVEFVFRMPLRGVVGPATASSTSPTSGPTYEWVDQSAACPTGEVGAITWQEIYQVDPYRATGVKRDYQDTCLPPLGVPTLTGPASVNPGATYSVTWNAISTATHYQLGLNDGQSTSTVSDDASTGASLVASTTVGHVDQLWARACDATRCGDWSAPISVTVVDPANPAAPTVTAPATAVTGQNVTVSWTAVSSPGGYAVRYEMTGQTADGTQVTPYSGTSLSTTVVASAPAGSTYTFSVRACDTYGCSGWKSASTTVNPTIPATAPNLAVQATVYPGKSYPVSWGAVGGAATYELMEGATQSYSGSGNLKSFTASNAVGDAASFEVRACNVTGCGAWSAEKTVTVTNPPAPSVPGSLSAPATVVEGQTISTSWSASTDGQGYAVTYALQYRKDGASAVTLYSGTNRSASLANAGPSGAVYDFTVSACNPYVCSTTTTASTTVNPPIPAVPAFTSVPSTVYPSAGYTVNWGAVAGATRYELLSWDDAVGDPVVVYNGSGTSFAATASATVGQIQAYAVRACNVTGCSGVQPQQNVKVATPPAPAAVTISAPSSVIAGNSVAVSWGTSSSPGGYTLHYELVSNKDGGAASLVYSGNATSATGVASATPAGSTYGFGVRACDTYNCSSYTWTSTLVKVAAPASAPTISATSSVYPGKTVAVSWTSVAGATSYTVEYFVDGSDQGVAYTGAATSLTTGAASGTVGVVYTYKVRACNSTGCSGWSAGASATVVKPPVPAVPSLSATATVIAGGSISVSWGSSSSPEGYSFHYEVQESINGAAYADIYSGSGTSKAVGTSATGTYNFRVRGCDTYGCSGYRYDSTTVNPPVPAAPALSGGGNVYPSKGFTISWSGVSGATSYQLYQSGSSVYDGSGTSKAFTAGGTVGSQYPYQVRACNATGCSGLSSQVTVTVVDPPAPSTPSSLSVPSTVAPGGSMAVSWGASSDPEGYGFNYRLYGRLGTSGTWTLHSNSTARSDTVTAPSTTGTYYWIVRTCDAYNCSTDRTGSTTVKVAETTLNASVSASSISIGKTSGSITISASGGTGSYTYLSPKFVSGYQTYNGDTVSAGLSGNRYTWTVYSGTGSVAVSATYQIGVTSGTQTKTFNVTVWWTAGNGM